MKLKSVVFYQSVQLWNKSEAKTVNEGDHGGVEIDLREGIVTLYLPGQKNLIIVPTANMRLGTCEEMPEGGQELSESQVEILETIKADPEMQLVPEMEEALKKHKAKKKK